MMTISVQSEAVCERERENHVVVDDDVDDEYIIDCSNSIKVRHKMKNCAA